MSDRRSTRMPASIESTGSLEVGETQLRQANFFCKRGMR